MKKVKSVKKTPTLTNNIKFNKVIFNNFFTILSDIYYKYLNNNDKDFLDKNKEELLTYLSGLFNLDLDVESRKNAISRLNYIFLQNYQLIVKNEDSYKLSNEKTILYLLSLKILGNIKFILLNKNPISEYYICYLLKIYDQDGINLIYMIINNISGIRRCKINSKKYKEFRKKLRISCNKYSYITKSELSGLIFFSRVPELNINNFSSSVVTSKIYDIINKGIKTRKNKNLE